MAHESIGAKANNKTGAWIAKALAESGISEKALSIQSGPCPEIAKLANVHGWKHGPHALVEIRNSVVHSSQKYGKISSKAYYEAWNLGQWYLELMF